MRVTALTKRVLHERRERRNLINDGFEEIDERGGKLWQLHRGCRIGHVITDVRIAPDGRRLFIKTSDEFAKQP